MSFDVLIPSHRGGILFPSLALSIIIIAVAALLALGRRALNSEIKSSSPAPRWLHYSVALLLSLVFAYERGRFPICTLRSRSFFHATFALSPRRHLRARTRRSRDFNPFHSVHYDRWDFRNEMKPDMSPTWIACACVLSLRSLRSVTRAVFQWKQGGERRKKKRQRGAD